MKNLKKISRENLKTVKGGLLIPDKCGTIEGCRRGGGIGLIDGEYKTVCC